MRVCIRFYQAIRRFRDVWETKFYNGYNAVGFGSFRKGMGSVPISVRAYDLKSVISTGEIEHLCRAFSETVQFL